MSPLSLPPQPTTLELTSEVGANVCIDGSVSPSSSGVSSLGSSFGSSSSSNVMEAEALLQLSNQSESDEGIVSDQSSAADHVEIKQLHNKRAKVGNNSYSIGINSMYKI